MALRAGWNDAAWGRPQRVTPDRLARCYELGYAGGLLFRRRNHAKDTLELTRRE